MQIQNFHTASMLQIGFPTQIVIHLQYKSIDFQTGPEGYDSILCVFIVKSEHYQIYVYLFPFEYSLFRTIIINNNTKFSVQEISNGNS
jgi:hypothetical protein